MSLTNLSQTNAFQVCVCEVKIKIPVSLEFSEYTTQLVFFFFPLPPSRNHHNHRHSFWFFFRQVTDLHGKWRKARKKNKPNKPNQIKCARGCRKSRQGFLFHFLFLTEISTIFTQIHTHSLLRSSDTRYLLPNHTTRKEGSGQKVTRACFSVKEQNKQTKKKKKELRETTYKINNNHNHLKGTHTHSLTHTHTQYEVGEKEAATTNNIHVTNSSRKNLKVHSTRT